MFRKRTTDAAPSAPAQQAPRSMGGYQSSELVTFHGKDRKVVVYTSDSSGKIIKTYKK